MFPFGLQLVYMNLAILKNSDASQNSIDDWLVSCTALHESRTIHNDNSWKVSIIHIRYVMISTHTRITHSNEAEK